jgi:hypothetical protein
MQQDVAAAGDEQQSALEQQFEEAPPPTINYKQEQELLRVTVDGEHPSL